MVAAPLYDLVGVGLDIDGTPVLDGVDLTIAGTGITVVVGRSGAGKSMLLRLLNRLEVPSAGEVRYRGRPLDALDPLDLRRRVGMVFQRPAPFPGSVRDNLLVADPTAAEADLVAALADARLDAGFLDRSADDLSGGEAQRMCLARTLVTRPDALLMDEPTSALDPDARRALERTARRLADGGRPVVWVTHDLPQAERLADALVALVDGHVASDAERARFVEPMTDAADAGRSPDAGTSGHTAEPAEGGASPPAGDGHGGDGHDDDGPAEPGGAHG